MKKILLVEDNEYKGRAIQRVLRIAGINVVLVTNLEDAQKAIVSETFDGILTDWDFPHREGLGETHGAGRAVVGLAHARRIPVAVFSGNQPELSEVTWFVAGEPDAAKGILEFFNGVIH